jgi:hypothetical protein
MLSGKEMRSHFFKVSELFGFYLAQRRKDAKTQRKNAKGLKVIDEASNTVFDKIGVEVDE